MKLLVVQLSDIHFRDNDNPVLERVTAIKKAIQAANSSFDACLLAVTGDIAFSGGTKQYEIADGFFDSLVTSLKGIRDGLQVEQIFIPGNHDCDLPRLTKARQAVIGSVLQSPPADENDDDSPATSCLEVQRNFFDFAARRYGTHTTPQTEDQLYFTREFVFGRNRVKIDCYNTAWMSMLHEKQGELLAPIWLPQTDSTGYDLAVSIFHHPYNWLEAVNAKAFRHRVEHSSDVIMTGHEHVNDQYNKRTIGGEVIEYFEGAVLQDNYSTESGFNILVLDLEQRQQKVIAYSWEADHYSAHAETEWIGFERSKRLGDRKFGNVDNFKKTLNDAGAKFTHPSGVVVTLADIFIYPDLHDRSLTKRNSDEALSRLVRGTNIVGYINLHKRVVVTGSERSGKTSLARRLYSDFHAGEAIPIYLSGDQIKTSEENAFHKLIERSVADQYGSSVVESFKQQDQETKTLIIDDFHLYTANKKAKSRIVEIACKSFGKVVIIASDVFQLEDFIYSADENDALLDFRHCHIREFGFYLRGKLIEKWLNLGQNDAEDERASVHKVDETEKLVNTLLGRSLLPSYPIFILTILQGSESSRTNPSNLGAYGYHYEALITAALINATSKLKSATNKVTLDTLYTYLSNVAYQMFDKQQKFLSDDELEQVTHQYKTQHAINFKDEMVMSILTEARMLISNGDDSNVFQYKYIYYYFVAKYIADNLHTQSSERRLRDQIRTMINGLHIEDNANIVIFLVYLTKDERIIAQILSDAKQIFASSEPCNFDSDVTFIGRLYNDHAHTPIQLTDGRIQEHKDEHRQHMDDSPSDGLEQLARETDNLDANEPLRIASRINVAFKTLQIMGQILRNFPGALPGDLKLQIATESYTLGLRTLQTLLQMFEKDLDDYRHFFSMLIKHHFNIQDEKKLAKVTDEALASLLMYASYGITKRVSEAVGSEYLEETYKQVKDARIPLSIELIGVSIKLDHFQKFPDREIRSLYSKLDKNHFVSTILRHMVRDHLYLFPETYRTKQSICEKLRITVNDPRILTDRDKRVV